MECFGRSVKEKDFYCAVKLLDHSEISFNIQKETKGSVLLDKVYRRLNLLETDYFGLRYLDSLSQTHWLDATKAVSKQIKNGPPFTLYFGVKFYTEDPCKLREEVTRYQFFLQIKMDMLQGRLPCTFAVAAELCAYAVQSELGDYDNAHHSQGYISEFRFVPNQIQELESQISDIHRNLRGQTPSVAELNFLERAKWLDMYGVDLHPVIGEDNIEYLLGLTPTGVVVYRNKSKVAQYFWQRISKIHFKETDFTLKVRGKDGVESEYVFQLTSKPACKHLWKCCIEQHAFFRLPQSMEGGVLGRGSSFSSKQYRHSGRTQREAIEAASESERPQPRVSRTPSKRYQRRASFPDASPHHHSMVAMDNSGMMGNGGAAASAMPHSRSYTPVNRPSGRDSPNSGISSRSVPWENNDVATGGLFTPAGNSPAAYSSSSKRRSKSRGPSPGPRRYYSDWSGSESEVVHSWKKHNRKAMSEGGASDHEPSHRRHHHHRHRRRRSRGANTSGSESESQHHDSRRHRHHQRSNDQMVESEAQWAAVQQGQREHGQMREAGDMSVKRISRDSYANGSPVHRNQRHHSREYNEHHKWLKEKRKSQDPVFAEELRRHIKPELVDPTQYAEEDVRDIPYTNVELAANQKRPSLHRLHDDPTGSPKVISDSEHSARHSSVSSRKTSASHQAQAHKRYANSRPSYQSDGPPAHPLHSEGEESTHSSRQRLSRTNGKVQGPSNGDSRKSPYTAYLRGDPQPQRRPAQADHEVVRENSTGSNGEMARYTVNANAVNTLHVDRNGVQQEVQLHDGMMDMRLHSREDSGIDEHDESVHDRSSPLVHQNGSSQMARQRIDANCYHGNSYSPDPPIPPPYPTTHQLQQQSLAVNHGGHHPAVDQGFRADSQNSVGPESAYCGSETHDPPLPIPSRIQMGTSGRSPIKENRRKPVANTNGHINHGAHPEHGHQNMHIHYEHENQLKTNSWSQQQQQQQQQHKHYHANNGVNSDVAERPIAVDQKPRDNGEERGDVDEVGKMQQFPQRGQRPGNRPMLGKRYSITTMEVMRVSQSDGDNHDLLTEL